MSRKRKKGRRGRTADGRKLALQMAAALLLLGGAVWTGLWWERNTEVRDVRFLGHRFTPVESLRETIPSVEGLHPDSVRFDRLIESLNTLPYVRETAVRMSAGGRMVVEIREREPIALLAGNSGRHYVDSEGVKLPGIPEKALDLPLLHGFSVEPADRPLEGEEFAQIRDFLDSARESRLGWITISEIGWSREYGVIALTQENGVKLLFGRGDFDRKLAYWDEFYSEVVPAKGIRNFSEIDLRFRNQIVTR